MKQVVFRPSRTLRRASTSSRAVASTSSPTSRHSRSVACRASGIRPRPRHRLGSIILIPNFQNTDVFNKKEVRQALSTLSTRTSSSRSCCGAKLSRWPARSPKGVSGGYVDAPAAVHVRSREGEVAAEGRRAPRGLQRLVQGPGRPLPAGQTSRRSDHRPARKSRDQGRARDDRVEYLRPASSVASTSFSCSVRAVCRWVPPSRPTGAARSRASPGRATPTRRSRNHRHRRPAGGRRPRAKASTRRC